MTEDSLTLHQLLDAGSAGPSAPSWIAGVCARIRSSPSRLTQLCYLGISNLGLRMTEWAERRLDTRPIHQQIEETWAPTGHQTPKRKDQANG
jgi:hypothetical protein